MKKLPIIGAVMIAAAFTLLSSVAYADDPYISTAGNHGNEGEQHFIDTAWTITAKTRVELDYALLEDWNSSWGSSYLFGGSGQSPWFTAFVQNGYIGFHNGSGWKEIRVSGVNSRDVRFTAILDNANDTASLESNGSVVGSVAAAHQATYGTATLKIASHTFGTNNFAAIKIYGIRIYEDGAKMRDYSPLVKGGVAGFRDAVTGTFLSGVALTASENTPVEEDDPYLATDGASTYVDTLWTVTPQTRFELDYALIDDYTSTDSVYLFGGSGQSPSWFTAFLRDGNDSVAAGVGFANGLDANNNVNWKTGHLGALALKKDVRHTAVIDNANGWVGTLLAGVTNSYSVATSAASFQSGTIKIASHVNVQNFSAIKIYGYRIFEGGVKVHDYTPMRKGGQLGFKDSVTGAFFADAHTVLLTAGGAMPEEQDDGYVATPSGNSAYYIDTEYKATSNTCVMLDCALRDKVTGNSYTALFHGAGSTHFLCFINPSPSIGFGVQTVSATSSIVGLDEANATGIRRTFVLDAYNRVGYATTAGLTNGIKTIAQSTEHSSTVSVKIGAKFDGTSNFSSLKVYGCKIYEKGTLVRDFRPCVIGPAQDGSVKVGMKDSLTGLFVSYPAATDENRLGCGGKIDCPPYVETLRLDKRYIDTGYLVTPNTKVALDYAPAEARVTGDTWYLFGASGTKRFVALINNSGFGFSNDTWNHLGVGMATEASYVNVRRTIILDNPAALGVVVTEGVTNISHTVDSAVGKSYGTKSLKISALADANDHFPSIRIYGCKVWEKENGEYVLKRDYVPAVVNGIAGLQDILLGGEFKPGATSASSPITYGGAFKPTVSQSTTKVSVQNAVTLTASAPGAASYRWLKNGEPIEGGTSGTLMVNWRKPKNAPTDAYQAVAVYSIDGLTAESATSSVLTIENVPAGMVILFK